MRSKEKKNVARPGTYTVKKTTVLLPPPKNVSMSIQCPSDSNISNDLFLLQENQDYPTNPRLPCIHDHLPTDGSSINIQAAPIDLRMGMKLNEVDILKQKFKIHKRQVPPISLPTWDKCPLDSKLPDFRGKAWPDENLYFTRGKVGQPLYYTKKRNFIGSDPLGSTNPINQYTALHDPHARQYFKQDGVKKMLQRNKLINSNNEVICNTKEYNRFRHYLSTLQQDKIKTKIQQNDCMKKFHMNIRAPFHKFKRMEVDKDDTNKYAQIKENREMDAFQNSLKYDNKLEEWKKRIEEVEKERKLKQLVRIAEVNAKDYNAMMKREAHAYADFLNRKRLLGKTVFEIKKAIYNKKYDDVIHKILKDRLQIDQVIRLKMRDEQVLELKEIIDDTIKRNKRLWIKRYEQQIIDNNILEKQKLEVRKFKKERELKLQRKYFDKWGDFISRHRLKKVGSEHISNFKIEQDMRDMVDYLEQRIGYDPNQDVFLRIFHHSKKPIKYHPKAINSQLNTRQSSKMDSVKQSSKMSSFRRSKLVNLPSTVSSRTNINHHDHRVRPSDRVRVSYLPSKKPKRETQNQKYISWS